MTNDEIVIPNDDAITADIHEDTAEHTRPENTIDLDTDIEDDVTFEQDNDTRENTRPDAMAKIAKLKDEIARLKTEKQGYLDNWQRDKAEFMNARKRDDESKAEYMKFAHVGIFEDLLPVIDSFESAIKHEGAGEGISLIYNQFKGMLKKYNIEAIGTVGEPFDPSFHQAIGSTPLADGAIDHTISEILQLGYKSENKVIRPALVKVFQA